MTRPHVVIIGAGFGGVYTAKYLLPYVRKKLIDLTIINRTNYFLFTPLLHEVATGGLRATSVSESIREIFEGEEISIYQSEVTSVDPLKKIVTTGRREISYNYLVVATGAETNYYDTPGARENTLPLKNLLDAVNIRNKTINAFEEAALTSDEEKRKQLLSFVVVGAGATGVETVAEMAEFITGIRDRFYRKNKDYKISDFSLTLISSGKEILKVFNKKIQKISEKRLKKIGVNLLLDTQVQSVEKDAVNFSNGRKISAETVIWTAGVVPILPKFMETNFPLVSGRIKTDQYLKMDGQENIFVLGDSAGAKKDEKDIPPPMLAQVAIAQSKTLAENIIAKIKNKPLSPFIYKSKGSMISLGQWFAAGEISGLTISGKITWWIWRTAYLFKFASWKKRAHIVFEWTIDLFYPRDITKLI